MKIWCKKGRQYYGTVGAFWECEDRALKSMLADGYRIKKMAAVLDRSYDGTIVRLKTLGLR